MAVAERPQTGAPRDTSRGAQVPRNPHQGTRYGSKAASHCVTSVRPMRAKVSHRWVLPKLPAPRVKWKNVIVVLIRKSWGNRKQSGWMDSRQRI